MLDARRLSRLQHPDVDVRGQGAGAGGELPSGLVEQVLPDPAEPAWPERPVVDRYRDRGAQHRGADPRVAALVSACAGLAEDVGAWPGTDVPAALDDPVDRRRADYALVAGGDAGRVRGAIADGVASVRWICVPPATFDAADDTVDWSITPADASVVATVRVGLTGVASPRGVEVALRAGDVSGEGVLDANGVVALALSGPDGRQLTEDEAWDHDWSTATIVIGADRGGEDATVRQRIRDFARGRLTHPGADAFLAEILAAESDY